MAATYVYWKTIDRRGLSWAIPFGILWGLALGVKNGGWLLPVGLGVWTLLYYRTWRHIARLIIAGCIAVGVFIVSWPWLYVDTLSRLVIYMRLFFVSHADLLTMQSYYLGRIYAKTPWHYPLVMTAAVVPLTVLTMIVIGVLAVAAGGRKERTGWLFVLSALGPMTPFLMGITAGYDGERLFLPAFPFLAALGGLGCVRLSDALWRQLWRRLPLLTARRNNAALQRFVTAALIVLVAAPPLAAIMRLHPYEMEYYSETVGGIAGAARLGLETTFWADSYGGALAYLNQNVAPRASVWADAHSVLLVYQEIGRLRGDIVIRGSNTTDPDACDWAIVQTRQSRYTPAVVKLMTSSRPQTVVSVDSLPLLMVYRVK